MKSSTKKILLWFLDLGINVAVIVSLVLIIQTWFMAPFDISGMSMCDTFNVVNGECQTGYGEKIIINEATYIFNEPQRGDVVVFRVPDDNEKYFIKRIIGLPGETVEVKNGNVYITKSGEKENFKLEEDYISPENQNRTLALISGLSVFEVPENHYFVLGDNRNSSTDSRSCFLSSINKICKENPVNAFVSRDLIRGKAWIVWWPLSNIRIVGAPGYTADQVVSESLDEK
ncbi:MAG: signal peptidase I [Candidatus Peregrinibacteria bacterium]